MSRKSELIITILGDLAILSAVFFISWKASYINFPATSWHAFVANFTFLIFWFFMFQTFDLYEPRQRIQIMNETFRMFNSLALGIVIIIALAFIMNINFVKAKGFLPSYVITIGSLLAWRLLWRGIVGEYIKPTPKKVVIFKNGEPTEKYHGFDVVKEMKFSEISPTSTREIFKKNNFDGIVIESNGHASDDIMGIISRFAETEYEIYISPKLYALVYNNFLIQKVADSTLLRVIFHPLSNWDRFLKRVTDIVLASLAFFAISPMIAVLAILIKIDSPGPSIYKQNRVGYRGRKYQLYKFRSMVTDAEKHTGPVWAKKNDARITRMGQIMRPLRLDELPQLFNVLNGTMSFVGPRPERPHFVSKFEKEIPFYRLRLTVHPGITGLAQVKHSYDRTVDDVRKKLEYDLEYINNLSLRLDSKIFLKTVLTVLNKEGAH